MSFEKRPENFEPKPISERMEIGDFDDPRSRAGIQNEINLRSIQPETPISPITEQIIEETTPITPIEAVMTADMWIEMSK